MSGAGWRAGRAMLLSLSGAVFTLALAAGPSMAAELSEIDERFLDPIDADRYCLGGDSTLPFLVRWLPGAGLVDRATDAVRGIIEPSDCPPYPVSYRSGVGQLLAFGALTPGGVSLPPAAGSGTTYERWGNAGYQFRTWGLPRLDMNNLTNGLANTTLSASNTAASTSLAIFQAAFSDRFVAPVAGMVAGITGALSNAIFHPLAAGFLALGAVWAAWTGVAMRKFATSLQGVIWAAATFGFALVFFAHPSQVIDGANRLVLSFGSTVFGALTADCAPPAACGSAGSQPPAVLAAVDNLHEALVRTPWRMGTFGTDDEVAKAAAEKIIQGSVIGADDATVPPDQLRNLKAATYVEGIRTIFEPPVPVAGHDAAAASAMYQHFTGAQGGSRIAMASIALLANLSLGLLILVLAASIIVLRLGFLLLVATAPLFLLAGLVPGAGRLVALRWLEMLVGTVLKQMAALTVIGVVVRSVQVIQRADASWFAQVLLTLMMCYAAVAYRRQFTELFTQTRISALGGGGGDVSSAFKSPRPIKTGLAGYGMYRQQAFYRQHSRDRRAARQTQTQGRSAGGETPGTPGPSPNGGPGGPGSAGPRPRRPAPSGSGAARGGAPNPPTPPPAAPHDQAAAPPAGVPHPPPRRRRGEPVTQTPPAPNAQMPDTQSRRRDRTAAPTGATGARSAARPPEPAGRPPDTASRRRPRRDAQPAVSPDEAQPAPLRWRRPPRRDSSGSD